MANKSKDVIHTSLFVPGWESLVKSNSFDSQPLNETSSVPEFLGIFLILDTASLETSNSFNLEPPT